MDPKDFPSSLPRKQLDRQHPDFAMDAPDWELISILSAGAAEVKRNIGKVLRQRQNEPQAMFEMRAAHATYENRLGQIAGKYSSALFQQAPEIDVMRKGLKLEKEAGPVAAITKFASRVDQSGLTFERFLAEVFRRSLFEYGVSWIMVDRPRGEAPRTRADERETTPFLVNHHPRVVQDWHFGDDGKLSWVKLVFEYDAVAPDPPFERTKMRRWVYYTRLGFVAYESKAADNGDAVARVDLGDHIFSAQERVPFVYVELPDGLRIVKRILSPLLKYFNLSNALDWALHNAALPIPVINGDAEQVIRQSQGRSETGFIQLGIDERISYLEPTGTSFGAIADRIDRLNIEIHRLAFILADARDPSSTAAAQSGISKEADSQVAEEAKAGLGAVVAQMGVEILNAAAAAMGIDDVEIQVRGFDFRNGNTALALESVSAAKAIGVQSQTFERELQKRAVDEALPGIDPSLKAQIHAEIDAAPSLEERRQAEADAIFDGLTRPKQKQQPGKKAAAGSEQQQ